MSNLKQIGLAVMQYTQDYDERLPRTPDQGAGAFGGSGSGGAHTKFMQSLASPNTLRDIQPYAKSIQLYVCPSSQNTTNPSTLPGSSPDGSYSATSYIGNGVVDGKALSAIASTASLVYMQENMAIEGVYFLRPTISNSWGGATNCSGGNFKLWHYNPAATRTDETEAYNTLHFTGGNLLYCDGHVKWRKTASIRSGDFGLTPENKTVTDDDGLTGACLAVNPAAVS